jgi:hypothetical protein
VVYSGINYFYEFLGLDEDSFRIFYDFSQGSGQNIESIPLGKSIYDGDILNSNDFFVNGSGDFIRDSGTFIKINNPETGLFSNESTFIISQKTKYNEDGVGGILFSNYAGEEIKSGFAFGINDANKFFFQMFDNTGPVVFNTSYILGEKNLLSVSLGLNNVSLSCFDFNSKSLLTESFSINSNFLLDSHLWQIGSASYSNDSSLKSFDGYIDSFLYFNQLITPANIRRLSSGIYCDVEYVDPISGLFGSGEITGYSQLTTGITGVVGFENQITGSGFTSGGAVPIFQNVPIFGPISPGQFTPIFIGNVSQFCQNNSPIDVFKLIQSPDVSGIIGYNNVFSGFIYPNSGFFPLFGTVEITGTITGFINVPLINESGTPIQIQEGFWEITPQKSKIYSYGLDSISYLGQRSNFDYLLSESGDILLSESGIPFITEDSEDPDFGEIIIFPEPEFTPFNSNYLLSESGDILLSENDVPLIIESFMGDDNADFTFPNNNKIAVYNRANNNFELDDVYLNTGETKLFLNGLLQNEGGYQESGNIYNPIKILEEDYFIDAFSVDSTGFYAEEDFVLYDSRKDPEHIIYLFDGSISEIPLPISGNQFFLNGQKIYEGLQYEESNGNFLPKELISGISGKIVSIKEYEYQKSYTSNYDIEAEKFPRNTSLVYINGVRSVEYVERTYIDLISGRNAFTQGQNIYNNQQLFFE